MTRFDLRRTAAMGIGALATVLAAALAGPSAFAQAGGSDRMPGGVEARPSEPETGYRSRGLTPPPAAAARPTPPPPPLAQPAPSLPKAPEGKKSEAKKMNTKGAIPVANTCRAAGEVLLVCFIFYMDRPSGLSRLPNSS